MPCSMPCSGAPAMIPHFLSCENSLLLIHMCLKAIDAPLPYSKDERIEVEEVKEGCLQVKLSARNTNPIGRLADCQIVQLVS